MNINELCRAAHENAIDHGWWDEDRSFAETISLIHSELSEALEEYRDGRGIDEIYYACKGFDGYCRPDKGCDECEYGKPEGIPIELADTIIRICDACGQYGIDLDRAIRLKMEYNKTRPYKHGGKKI